MNDRPPNNWIVTDRRGETQGVTTQLSRETFDALTAAAQRENTSRAAIIRSLVIDYLAQKEAIHG